MKKRKHTINWRNAIPPLLFLIAIIGVLEIWVSVANVPETVFPAPHVILSSLVQNFARDLFPDTLFTLRIILVGYCISVPLGFLIAALCSQFKMVDGVLQPLVVVFVVTPMLTIVPLLMMSMGFNDSVRYTVVILMATPIITINSLTGFKKVESQKLELFRSMGASKLQTFRKLVFPNALPQVFVGLKLGCIFSTISAMSADLVIGKDGLGSKISSYAGLLNIKMAFATILVVALIGIILFAIMARIEKRVVVWVK